MSIIRRRVLVANLDWTSKYQEVEYLDSDGTGYDIPIYLPLTDMKMTGKVYAVGNVLNQNFFSNWASGMANSDYFYYVSVPGALTRWQIRVAGNFYNAGTINANVIYPFESRIKSGASYLKINGVNVVTTTQGYTTTVSRGPLHFLGTGLTYHCRSYGRLCIYNSDALWAELVPCYRKSDGVIGNYDIVSGTFYPDTNARLAKGPDV